MPSKTKKPCIVLGVTGGIAVYKACEVLRLLQKQGIDVYVVMTKNACQFVAPLTFETLSGHPVAVDTFERPATWEVEHIALAKRADLFLIAPATANIIGKMANGIADDMLTTTVMACKCHKIVSPAMNTQMFENPIVQDNLAKLERFGYVKRVSSRRQMKQLPPSQPMKFLSSDGLEIEVGKNSLQNERLTMGAKGDETWLHAQKMPGSHVIIHTTDEVPETTLMEAAMLAAYYSKGVRSAQVPVDTTLRRYIKKPGGTPPGFVIYTNQRTLIVNATEGEINAMETGNHK